MTELVLFHQLDDGIAYAEQVGFGNVLERGRLAAESLPNNIVYAGRVLGFLDNIQ